jgi:hypothetical protein
MFKFRAVFLLLVWGLMGSALAGVAGDWDVTAETSWGEAYSLTLSLAEDGGKITGTLLTPEGKSDLQNVKLEGNTLSFEVWVSGSVYTVKAEVDGDQMTGTWSGGGDNGTVKAKRKSS